MRILMIGDIVGRAGRKAVKEQMQTLRNELNINMVVANGENAAGGNGITPDIARDLFDYGVDVLTMGNHVWDKRDIVPYIDKECRIVRPANYPPGTPGRGAAVFDVDGQKVAVMNLSGRVYLSDLDCPFRKADELLQNLKEQAKIIILDFHAEATSEKIAMGWYLNGRVSVVAGTHTHVQTADERVLPEGTAYITDLGMTGPLNSVLGVKTDIILQKFLTQMPVRFEVADGPYQFNAIVAEIDEFTGMATSIERIYNVEY